MTSSELNAGSASIKSARGYRPDIDGLRAIAVSSVVLFHAGVPGFGGGFSGVDVFFVISGFLIGNIIYSEVRAGEFSFARFYARRARRILPALFVVVAASMIAGLALLTPQELIDLSNSACAALLAVSNIHFYTSADYFKPAAAFDPMLMTWSLGVEEQFYIFFPFILLILRRFSDQANIIIVGGLSIASLILCVALTAKYPSAAFYLLPARAWEMGAGVFLAIWAASGKAMPQGKLANTTSNIAGAALVGAIVFLNEEWGWPSYWAILPVTATAALVASPSGWFNRAVLGSKPFIVVGLISYSWYLWHWPLMAFVRVSSAGEPVARAMIVVVALGLLAGYLSWRYIERPFRQTTSTNSRALATYGAALAGGAGLVISVSLFEGLPKRFSDDVASIEKQVRGTRRYACLNQTVQASAVNNPCLHLRSAQPAIAVIGDSHAAALAPAVQNFAGRSGAGHAIFTRSSCRPFLGVRLDKRSEPGFGAACAEYMKTVVERVIQQRDIKTVILAGYWTLGSGNETLTPMNGVLENDKAKLLRQGLGNTIAALTLAGKTVFVAQDVPRWGFEPASVASSEFIPARRWLRDNVSSVAGIHNGMGPVEPSTKEIEAAVARATATRGGRLLILQPHLCAGELCRFAENEGLIYADHSHLTARGATMALAENWLQ